MASLADRAHYPASANQKRMYVLHQLSPGGTEYNVPVALRLCGRLDVRRLRQALSALVERHAALRTSFALVGEEIVQRVARGVRVPLPRRRAPGEGEFAAIKRGFVRPFDLRRAPLMRACLVRTEEEGYILLLDLHHIICDGVSVDILIAELGRLYAGQTLSRRAGQYKDFALWQRRFATTAEAGRQRDYWLHLLAGERPALNLPTDYPRQRPRSFHGDRVLVRPGEGLTPALRTLAAKHRVSMYMVLLAAYYVLLAKYTGQDDILVGTLVSGRPGERFENVVGLFVNTLVLRSRPRGELGFIEYLKQVRGECLEAFENQDYQFEELVDQLAPPRDLGRNPLFDTVFAVLAVDRRATRRGGVDFSRYELDYEIAKFDLSLTAIEYQDQELALELEYSTALFRRETIERLARHYLAVLSQVAADPSIALSQIDLRSVEERRGMAAAPVEDEGAPGAQSVVALFAAQAGRNPSAPALSYGGRTLSYGELDRLSSALAARLDHRGVARGELVGLVAAPSCEMVIAILGILKLGAAYLPLDPTTPVERFRSIVADAGLATVLIHGDRRRFGSCGAAAIDLIDLDEEIRRPAWDPPRLTPPDPADLAYVIYTSGSTGTPKGVMVSHGALANYVGWATETYVGGESGAFALHSPPSVDLTVTSIFVPLASGNEIVIYRGDDAGRLVREMVEDDRAHWIKLTPTHLRLLSEVELDGDPGAGKLRRIIVGGEDLETALAARIHARFGGRVEIWNEYGPTEAAVGCTAHRYQPGEDRALSVPIGEAIAKVRVCLLDGDGEPVPHGVVGRLHVSGVCLARGYLNNPRLTAERFVPAPWSPASERRYDTGDLARVLPGGELEFLGRSDDQVKLRGFRIELGEIEAQLRRLDGVREAVVTRRLDAAGDAYLCAYVVLDGEPPAAADLRSRLAGLLPETMIPTRFVPLARLPIGRGGKLDRNALPDPGEILAGNRVYAAPRSALEAAMAKVWEEVLGLSRVGIDDNFFALGGQSLKATLMAARVNRELHTNITLQDVFAHPVIRELAASALQTGEDPSAAIEPAGFRQYYPASAAQKRLYILNQLAPSAVQYNVPWAIAIRGELDAARWERAFTALIERHEALRTSLHLIEDEIVQRVEPPAPFTFESRSAGEERDLHRQLACFVRPFDLQRAPLIRGAILETAPQAHTLIFDMHHIISDGMSVEIIVDDLLALYQGRQLAALPVQYKDYATWQQAHAGDPAVREQEAFWTRLFEGEVPVLSLPTDFPRGAVQSFEGDLATFTVDALTTEGLKAINRKYGATLHMTLLAAYMILLAKYSGQEDVIVGTPVAGRSQAALQGVVGMFVNTLAMRNQPRGELRFDELLARVKRSALDAYRNQDFQFDELVDKLAVERDLSRSPLFDTVFAAIDDRQRRFTLDELEIEVLDFEWKISKFDVTLLAAVKEAGIDLEIEYCSRLFHRSTIERFGAHYLRLLEQIVRSPETRIAELDLLTGAERHQLLVELTDTDRPCPAARSIHAIIEQRVATAPDRIAVVDHDRSLSYLELNRRANQIARLLQSAGAGREEVVGIIAGPSLGMIVGILAALKAGCAYLPIDLDSPESRTLALLADSGARIVLASGGAEWRDDERLVLDLSDPSLYRGDGSDLDLAVGDRDLAYVIYTSGTTGAPKGVMIEHGAVNNLCAWHLDAFGVTAADRASKYARFSFDASVWEIFPYLEAGAALHMIDDAIRLDLPRLNRYFEDHGISISFLPTQVCELFMEQENDSLRVLLTGGDRLRLFRPQPYKLINNYGPTENTVVTSSGLVVGEEERIPIGRPLSNTRVALLDRAGNPVPVGVPGELCISGVGLARGYLNDPRRTAEKFLPSPFEPGGAIYRTGDLARWRPDGSIEFIGRTDKQVKIRGCRTEPREIEATILAHPAVKDAVVVAERDGDGAYFLAAYIVWNALAAPAELRAHLAEHLPDYMVPAFLHSIAAIPLNDRGKVDTAALPRPELAGRGYVAPRSEVERRLAAIWCAVLEREEVGVHDNFFEIGGHSLRATIMLAKANRELAAEVSLGVVFDHPSIASLAPHFEAVTRPSAAVLQPAPGRLTYATTQTQKLLYVICTSQKGIEYNLPMAFRLQGDLDVLRLENVFRRLIDRHEALRTAFRVVHGEIVQTVQRTVEFAIDILEEADADGIHEVMRDFVRPFDLGRAPLMRVALVPMGGGGHVLLLDLHHLVSDGTSMGILFEEMAALYSGAELPLPEATVKDFAEWLGGHLETEKVRKQEEYWRATLTAPPPPVRLDTDYPRSASFSFAGAQLEFEAPPEIYRGLKTICVERRATLYMVLLAAYTVMLSKFSGREDIIVGVPTAGRYLADVQDLIGMFVSTHAVRSRPFPGLRFDEFLEQVKTAVRGALENQEYQLWDMMLRHTHTNGGKPLFSTIFVVQDQAFEAMQIPGLDVEEMTVPYHVSKFDLTLAAVERAGRLEFDLEYSTDLFKRSTAKRIARNFLTLLEQIVADPERELRQLELLTAADKRELLLEFNHRTAEEDDRPERSADGTVVEACERQAHEFPHRLAVLFDGHHLSYGELERRADGLARRLASAGVAPGDVVGVLAGPSLEMVTGVLAVWKAAAACLPLSGSFPAARIGRLLAAGGAKLLLGDALRAGSLPALAAIDLKAPASYPAEDPPLASPGRGGDLALLTFIADRAGLPRGVMIDHRALLDRCRWFVERFALTTADRGTKYGDLTTSASPFELLPFLAVGAAISILPERVGYDRELLTRRLAEEGATLSWLPAPLCEHLASEELPALRALITSGRTVSPERRGSYELVCCYGSAECTEILACTAVGSGGGSVVGRPVPRTAAYVLAHDGGLQPVGVAGELWVAGAGLARGYLDDAAATARRFTTNPHARGARMVRTGDTARWLPDGRLEITGRPGQVNIDGHRACLAEIERSLLSHPDVSEAVVLFDDLDPRDERLIAYLVLRQGLPVSADAFVQALRSHLAAWLPPYLIPDTYIKVGMIPREADGRVEHERLPMPERDAAASDRSRTTRRVTSIVEELLDQPVGADADLFELGMSSLTTMELLARLNGTLGFSPTVEQMLSQPTISGVSDWLSQALHSSCRTVAPPEQESRLP